MVVRRTSSIGGPSSKSQRRMCRITLLRTRRGVPPASPNGSCANPLSGEELFKIGRLDPTRRASEASARAEASARSVRPLRKELVGRVLVARVQPGLGDFPVLEVEHEHAVVSERPALSLGGRSGQSDAVFVIGQDVMQFLAEGPPGQLDQPAEQPHDLVDSLIVTGQLVSARAVPHDIRREVFVPQGIEVAFREGLEAVAKPLLVRVSHAEPPFVMIGCPQFSGSRREFSKSAVHAHRRDGVFMRPNYCSTCAAKLLWYERPWPRGRFRCCAFY